MSKWTRFTFATDTHGDMMCLKSVEAFHKFCKVWKPTIRVFGGDGFDLRALRRGATEEEKRDSMLRDYEMGWKFIDAYKPTTYLRGNHCERLWDMAAQDKGVISDYAKKCTNEIETRLAKMRCQMLPYDRRAGVYTLGKLSMVHGFGGGGKTTARTHCHAFGNVLVGHTHAVDHYVSPSITRSFGMTVGCLCDLDMSYMRATIGSLTHSLGWAYGICDEKTGDFRVWQAEKIGDQFIAAGEPLFL